MFCRPLRRSAYIFIVILGIILAYISTGAINLKPRSVKSSSRRFSTSSFSANPSSTGSDIPYKYNIAVAYQPKERDENKFVNQFFKFKKVDSPTGEDNYFIAQRSSRSSYLQAKDQDGSSYPQYLLDEAFKTIKKEQIVKVGGTTACLGVFQPDGILRVANLGDSWCGIFRENKLIAETKVQTHGFNTPYQLAIIPKELLEKQDNRFIMDKPLDADEYEFKVMQNDIVLFATDGVIDNIDIKDIELFLKDNQDKDLSTISKTFVKEVNKLSVDENFPSVFSQELSKLTGQFYTGGKEDDITVVFVKVDQ
ncbi:unnamed protein product [Wickerhamomyces anomalus]